MTEHKHLKRLVRERMARTGETYTTARRHVLARAVPAGSAPGAAAGGPPREPGLLPGYDRFGGTHHLSGLARNALAQAGVRAPHTGEPYTEAMLCGLAGGIGFMYFVFEYAGQHPTMTVVTQHHPEPYVPAALDRAGVPYETLRTSSAAVAEKNLRRTLEAGRAALCTVAKGALPWHEESHPFAAADPYEVTACGLDESGGVDTVLVDDEWARPNRVALPAFLAAWSAHRKGRHRLLAVTGAPPAGHDLAAAVRDAVGTTVAHLTGPVLGNNFDVNFGFSGMERLAGQLADPTGRAGWARRYAAPGALGYALRRLHECLELEYGGPGATRPLYADFLTEAAPLAGPELAEAAAGFRAAGALWSQIAATALAAADAADTGEPAGPADRDALLAELAARVGECLRLERSAAAALSAAR